MNAVRMSIALTLGIVLAAQATAQEAPKSVPDAPPAQLTQPQVVSTQPPQYGLSDWLTYRDQTYRGEFDGKVCSPAIGTELFVRVGDSVPFGSGVFAQTLNVGWMIEAGGRVLFYNPYQDGAWVLEASFVNNYNHAPTNDHDILVLGSEATVHSLNRTFLQLGIGHDWRLAPLDGCGKLDWGLDCGFRYGTGEAAFYEIPDITSPLIGSYLGIHTDLQIPYGCFVFEMGLRAELAYTHSYQLVQVPNDLMDFNFLVNFGVRY